VQHLHVFNIDEVVGQMFDPGAQVWRAIVTLVNNGGKLHLQRHYDAGAPAAVDVLSAAFAGEHGCLRQLAGQVWLEGGEIVCDPWSVSGDSFIVPDCEGTTASLQPTASPPAEDADSPARARAFLAGALHAGVRRRDGTFQRRGQTLAGELEVTGYAAAAERMKNWLACEDVASFGRLAVWLSALLER
jgi:hypothetical protein